MSPPAPTLADQQRAFDAFRRVSDEERPHEALGQRPPDLEIGRLDGYALRIIKMPVRALPMYPG